MTGVNSYAFTLQSPLSCQLSSLVIVVTFRRMPNEIPANDKNPPQTQADNSVPQALRRLVQEKLHLAVDSLNLFPQKETSKRGIGVSTGILPMRPEGGYPRPQNRGTFESVSR
jgi:hypothetical protein